MITWNPPNTLFTIPYLNLDVHAYGLIFASGFIIGYYLMCHSLGKLLNNKDKARKLTDKLTTYSVLGCVIGARLGHVLFYDFDYFLEYPHRIFFERGGLASHGGAIGVLIAFLLYWRTSRKDLQGISFFRFFDLFVVPVALVGFMIRMGNFINQEILGNATEMPWGIVFLNAVDGGNDFARHPVQLYEGLFYLLTFVVLKNLKPRFDGFVTGCFFILIFGSRFFIEFFKSSQGGTFDEYFLQTGQLLSIPFIIAGFWMILRLKSSETNL